MTRKHFKAIAEIIKQIYEARERSGDYQCGDDAWSLETLTMLVHELCDYFATQNEHFDKDKFQTACGLGEE